MSEAKRMLDLAARSAMRAVGDVEPNPLVGAVLVRDGRIIGAGHHRKFGDLHAEREALADCARRGESPKGATIYVTLEPCCHHGKQPPCTDALIQAGVAKVVVARRDPAEVSGGGEHILREAGIQVEYTNESPLARGISAPFFKRVRTGLPWVIAKWAQTVDGRVATRSGESQWISCEQSRRRVHHLRSTVDAILIGSGTAIADDPLLTARGTRRIRRVARRVVADTGLDVPVDCALVRSANQTPVTFACASEMATAKITAPQRASLEQAGVEILGVPMAGHWLDLEALLRELYKRHDVSTVLVEAGPGVLGSMMEKELIDEAVVYIAPLMLGDEMARSAATGRVVDSLSAGRRFETWRVKRVGPDIELVLRAPEKPE